MAEDPNGRAREAEGQAVVAAPPNQARGARQSLRFLVSAVVIALLVYIIDWREFAAIAKGARIDVLVLATLLQFTVNTMVTLRWKMLLAPVGVHVSFMQAFRSYLKGHVMAYFVPVSITADIVKAVDLNQARARGTASQGIEVVSSIFIERAYGAISVGFAVALGLWISPLGGEHADTGDVLLFAAVVLIGCCCIALFADKLLAVVPDRLLHRLPRLEALFDRARISMAAYRSQPGVLVGVMLFSLLIQAMRILPVYLVGVAIGAGDLLFAYVIAVPVIYMVNSLPVIGGRIGPEQGMFVLLLGLGGVDPEAAMVVAMVSLVLSLVASLPGAWWLVQGRAAEARR